MHIKHQEERQLDKLKYDLYVTLGVHVSNDSIKPDHAYKL